MFVVTEQTFYRWRKEYGGMGVEQAQLLKVMELENARLYTLETMMRQELEMQDAQKTEFLHSVAHELKTPLTAIISSSELMSTDGEAVTPSIKERLVANINRSAWLMDRRVGELLDLAKIQIGNLKLQLQPLEISVVIDEVVSQLSSLFKNKGQSLTVEIQDSLPQVKADKERVNKLLKETKEVADILGASILTLRGKRKTKNEKRKV